jgi:hypothetical protein
MLRQIRDLTNYALRHLWLASYRPLRKTPVCFHQYKAEAFFESTTSPTVRQDLIIGFVRVQLSEEIV